VGGRVKSKVPKIAIQRRRIASSRPIQTKRQHDNAKSEASRIDHEIRLLEEKRLILWLRIDAFKTTTTKGDQS